MRKHALILGVIVAAAVTAGPAVAATPAPRVSALIAPTGVKAKQGHVRFLVGVKTSTQARVIIRVLSVKTGKVVRIQKTATRHRPGRVWFLVEGTTNQGFQLPVGAYRLEVYAVDARKRRSNTLRKKLSLAWKPPRGIIEAYTVPAWPSIISGIAPAPGGQIVAAIGKRGTAPTPIAAAGLATGDVIRTVNGVNVDQRGAWLVALRNLPAGTPVPIEFDRAGVRQPAVQYTAPPDWTARADYKGPLAAAVTAAPTAPVYRFASVRERVDAKDFAAGESIFGAWTALAGASGTAPWEYADGLLNTVAGSNPNNAGGPFNRAHAADPTIAAVEFSHGAWRLANRQFNANQIVIAKAKLAAARDLDPTDAVAPTFLAFAHLATDTFPDALAAADVAVARDPRYEEARVARAIALIGLNRKAEGVSELKRGLLLMDDAARAQQFITSTLEPNSN